MKKGILQTLLLSNFLIFIFTILLSCVVMISYRINARNQSEKYNMAFLSQVKNTFDERLTNATDILNTISYDTSVQRLLLQKSDPDKYERYASLQLRNKLRDYTNTYSYIDSIIVYYTNSSLAVTDSSVYRTKSEFIESCDSAYWEGAEFDALVKDVSFIKYAGSTAVNDGREIFTIVKAIPFGASQGNNGYVIINYYYDFIQDVVGDLEDIQNGGVFINDNAGNCIFAIGNPYLKNETEQFNLLSVEQQKFQPVSIDEKEYLVSNLFSEITQFLYIFVMPKSAFINYGIDILLLATGFVGIIIGVTLCIVTAKHNAKPIVNITNMIRQHNPMHMELMPSINEIEFINQSTIRVMNEYSKIKDDFERQIPAFQSNIIASILKGFLHVDERSRSELNEIGIMFPNKYYMVMIFHFTSNNIHKTLNSSWFGMNLKNMLSGMLSQESSLYLCDLDINRVGVILNCDLGLTRKTDCMVQDMKQFAADIMKQHDMILTIAISGITQTSDDIHSLYVQSVEALDYLLFKEPGNCEIYSSSNHSNFTYSYSEDIKNSLILNVKSGNGENVTSILDAIFEENDHMQLSIEVFKSLFIDLFNTYTKTKQSLRVSGGTSLLNNNSLGTILECGNFTAMKEKLNDLFLELTTIILQQQKETNKPLIVNITQYIQTNYQDQTLSLNMLANIFHLNSSYLSSYFKKYTDSNFINYVNTVRLEKAKELLLTTEDSLATIAQKVGYTNSGIFINNFKRVYGMTPGNFRNSVGHCCEK